MTRPRVFLTRIIPDKGLQLVREYCEADVWEEALPPPYATLRERVRGADGLLCLLTDRVDGPLLDAAGPQLRVVSQHAVGYDNIDVAAATARQIPVGNTPGILTDATADFAFALLLAAARRVVEGDNYTRGGRWQTWGPSILLGPDVSGATLGIIGYGRIGRAVARRAAGFDMKILYHNPSPVDPALPGTPVALPELLQQADFVSVHAPLTEETRHLIDREALGFMRETAVLINTARGPIVDPEALYEALKERRIFAAALDVTAPEPLPAASPLLELDNLIITPHIASASKATRDRMALMAAENLVAGVRGKPLPHCVNPEVYEASP